MINDRCSTVDNTAISHILTAMVNMLNAFDKMHPDILVDKTSECLRQHISADQQLYDREILLYETW